MYMIQFIISVNILYDSFMANRNRKVFVTKGYVEDEAL